MTKSVLWNFAIIPILSFLNNPKDLDLSYKMDIDLWDYFGRIKLCLIIEEIQYLFPVSMPYHKNQIYMANYHTKSVCAANDHFPVSMPYRVAPCHPLQNSLTFPWHFTVFHILWQIQKKFFILYFNGVKCITSNLGLLLKERICSPREQILSFKSSPQCGWRWA